MKKLIIAAILGCLCTAASAADITITVTAQQAQRILDAFKKATGNPDATQADVRAHLIRELKAIVILGERKTAEDAIAAPAPIDIQ